MSVGLQIIICNDLIKSILFTMKYTVCTLDCTHLCIKPFCIPESFNTNISHQLFDYKINLMNSQLKNTNSRGDYIASINVTHWWLLKK